MEPAASLAIDVDDTATPAAAAEADLAGWLVWGFPGKTSWTCALLHLRHCSGNSLYWPLHRRRNALHAPSAQAEPWTLYRRVQDHRRLNIVVWCTIKLTLEQCPVSDPEYNLTFIIYARPSISPTHPAPTCNVYQRGLVRKNVVYHQL